MRDYCYTKRAPAQYRVGSRSPISSVALASTRIADRKFDQSVAIAVANAKLSHAANLSLRHIFRAGAQRVCGFGVRSTGLLVRRRSG